MMPMPGSNEGGNGQMGMQGRNDLTSNDFGNNYD